MIGAGTGSAIINPDTIPALQEGLRTLARGALDVARLLASVVCEQQRAAAGEASDTTSTIIYRGRRLAGDAVLVTREESGVERRLPLGTDAPAEWGSISIGSLHLTAALIRDACGPDAARAHAWKLCEAWVSTLPSDGWTTTGDEIRAMTRAFGWTEQEGGNHGS